MKHLKKKKKSGDICKKNHWEIQLNNLMEIWKKSSKNVSYLTLCWQCLFYMDKCEGWDKLNHLVVNRYVSSPVTPLYYESAWNWHEMLNSLRIKNKLFAYDLEQLNSPFVHKNSGGQIVKCLYIHTCTHYPDLHIFFFSYSFWPRV